MVHLGAVCVVVSERREAQVAPHAAARGEDEEEAHASDELEGRARHGAFLGSGACRPPIFPAAALPYRALAAISGTMGTSSRRAQAIAASKSAGGWVRFSIVRRAVS